MRFLFDNKRVTVTHRGAVLLYRACNFNGGCHGQCCALPVGARSTPTLDVDAIISIMWTHHMQPPFQKIAPLGSGRAVVLEQRRRPN